MRRQLFPSGTSIFLEGDPSREAYVLRSGRVEVLKESASGPLRLAVLGPGDVLGEMGLLEERPRSATARALDEVEVDAMTGAEFAEILTTDPARSIHVLRAMFERLRAVNERLSESVSAPAASGALPRAQVFPLTPETECAVPRAGLAIERFPFRVGRAAPDGSGGLLHFNELELPDVEPHVLASNHFSVDLGPAGLVVRDRGSRHGTVVNGVRIGAGAIADVAPLHAGENEVIAGPASARAAMRASPFRFRVDVA